jgi:hypothetical protein
VKTPVATSKPRRLTPEKLAPLGNVPVPTPVTEPAEEAAVDAGGVATIIVIATIAKIIQISLFIFPSF